MGMPVAFFDVRKSRQKIEAALKTLALYRDAAYRAKMWQRGMQDAIQQYRRSAGAAACDWNAFTTFITQELRRRRYNVPGVNIRAVVRNFGDMWRQQNGCFTPSGAT